MEDILYCAKSVALISIVEPISALIPIVELIDALISIVKS